MARRIRRPGAAPPNLAAKALGSKIFGPKVVTPKRGYTRKLKHRKGGAMDDRLPFSVAGPPDEDEP